MITTKVKRVVVFVLALGLVMAAVPARRCGLFRVGYNLLHSRVTSHFKKMGGEGFEPPTFSV